VDATDYWDEPEVDIDPADSDNWGFECWFNLYALPGADESPESVLVCLGGHATTNAIRLEAYGPAGVYNLMAHLRNVRLFTGGAYINAEVGNWVHAALVIEDGVGKLYFGTDPNGAMTFDGTHSNFPGYDPGAGVTIGCAHDLPYGHYYGTNGWIKNVRVFEFRSGEFDPVEDPLPLGSAGCVPYGPSPKYDQVVSPSEDITLSWQLSVDEPNCGALDHYQVYLDSDLSQLEARGNRGSTTDGYMVIPASELESDTTYYWALDAVYDTNVVLGPIWRFRTGLPDSFNVVGFYDMESSDTNLLVDVSGNGNDLPVIDGGTTDNEHSDDVAALLDGGTTGSQSLRLNGEDIYGLGEALLGGDGFVIEAYAKPAELNLGNKAIAGCGGWTNGELLSCNNVNWGVLRGGLAWEASGEAMDTRSWAHLAVIRGEMYNDGKITLLVNHEKVWEKTASLNDPEETYIGGMKHPNDYPVNQFQGWVDNVRLSTFTGNLKMEDLLPPVYEPYCGQPGQVYSAGDINKDCRVDWKDFALFAESWLESTDPSR
jgi:hypothetical protein